MVVNAGEQVNNRPIIRRKSGSMHNITLHGCCLSSRGVVLRQVAHGQSSWMLRTTWSIRGCSEETTPAKKMSGCKNNCWNVEKENDKLKTFFSYKIFFLLKLTWNGREEGFWVHGFVWKESISFLMPPYFRSHNIPIKLFSQTSMLMRVWRGNSMLRTSGVPAMQVFMLGN